MALQSSGAIAISNCSVELGWAANAQNDLNNSTMRSLANVPSGAISLSNFYGKSWNLRWSGSTVVSTYYGIEASGSLFRIPGGAWLSTYHGTFQSGSSYNGTSKIGLSVSGSAITPFNGIVNGTSSGTITYGSGFTGSATTTWSTTINFIWVLQTSGGSVRTGYSQYTSVPSYTYGPYVYLY